MFYSILHSSKLLVAFFCGVIFSLFCSCTKEDNSVDSIPEIEPVPEIISGVYKEWNISANGESVRLCTGVDSSATNPHYVWYEISDGSETKLDAQINNYFDIGDFKSKGIKLYKCNVAYLDLSDSLIDKSYIFHVAYTGLPLVEIETVNRQPVVSKEDKIPGAMTLMGGGDTISLEINGRGNSSWNTSPKQSYNLKFENKKEVCDMPKSKKWALIDNHHDRSLLRNSYVSYVNHNVFTNLGWNPSYKPCDFVLNGEYKGSYLVAERNKIESNRLNFKDISEVSDITEGCFLCEIDERFDEARHFRTTHGVNDYNGNEGIAICLKEPDEVTDEVFEYVKDVVQTAEDALFSDDFKDMQKGYAYYFDVDALVDWYLIHEFVCMYDASSFYTSAFFYFNPEDRKLHMGPCWDYDTGLRREVNGAELRRINSWYKRLFEDERFCQLVEARWIETREQLLNSIEVISSLAEEMRTSADYNFLKWDVLGTPYAGQPTWVDLKTYQDQVVFLSDWANERFSVLDEMYGKN